MTLPLHCHDPAIGNTPLVALPARGRWRGAGRVLLKVESANPSGFHKDRPALEIFQRVARTPVTVGTCGSIGLALARLGRQFGCPVIVFIPERYASAPVDAIRSYGARVELVSGPYESAVAASSAYALAEGIYDANPSGPGGEASLSSYEAIADEIVAQLGHLPDSVWVPTGNGTTLAGVARGFLRLAAGARPPRIHGAGSRGNTAAIASIRAGHVVELEPAHLTPSALNEPLLNWRSAHALEALTAVRATGGSGYEVTDAELVRCARSLRSAGLTGQPAGCAGLAGLAAALRDGTERAGTHVVVLTA